MKFSLVKAACEDNEIRLNGKVMGRAYTFTQWRQMCVIVVPADTRMAHVEQLREAMKNVSAGPCLISTIPLDTLVIRPTWFVNLHVRWTDLKLKLIVFCKRSWRRIFSH